MEKRFGDITSLLLGREEIAGRRCTLTHSELRAKSKDTIRWKPNESHIETALRILERSARDREAELTHANPTLNISDSQRKPMPTVS